MKNKYRKTVLISILLSIVMATWAQNPLKKEIHKEYNASEINRLIMECKFGNATITDNGSDKITVDVVIQVHNRNERVAQDILENIEIDVRKQGSDLYIETEIDLHSNKGSFNISYKVNIPKNKDIVASCKYGNLHVEDLTGTGVFEIAYGNFQGRNLLTKGKLTMEIAYGNGEVEQVNDLVLELKYGNFELTGKVNNVLLESKYSKLWWNQINMLEADSKNDVLKIGKVQTVVSDMAYTNLNINELESKLVCETGYGNVKVGYVSAGFDQVIIENRYGDISLEIDSKATYKVHIEGSYAGIKVPDSDRLNKVTDRQETTIKGIVGNGTPKGQIVAESSYGGIRISKN